VGAKSIEEYEDILKLKDKQINNNEVVLKETIKNYEDKISNLTVLTYLLYISDLKIGRSGEQKITNLSTTKN